MARGSRGSRTIKKGATSHGVGTRGGIRTRGGRGAGAVVASGLQPDAHGSGRGCNPRGARGGRGGRGVSRGGRGGCGVSHGGRGIQAAPEQPCGSSALRPSAVNPSDCTLSKLPPPPQFMEVMVVGQCHPKKRRLFEAAELMSNAESPLARPAKQLRSEEMEVNYGSEDDTDDDGDDVISIPVIPRSTRIYMEDFEDVKTAQLSEQVCSEWRPPTPLPPQPALPEQSSPLTQSEEAPPSSSAAPISSSAAPTSSSAAPTSSSAAPISSSAAPTSSSAAPTSSSAAPISSSAAPTSSSAAPTSSSAAPTSSSSSSSTAVGPSNKFEFSWTPIPQPAVDPYARREPFINDSGPLASFATPYDAFTAIWSREILEHIAQETNRYAQQCATVMLENGSLRPASRITQWRDTTADEMYVFFAIILATGIVVKSHLEEYWNKAEDLYCTPGFSSAMRYDRFVLLSKCLHFQDNSAFDNQLMTPSQAKMFKLKPILDHLNNKFSSLYNLGRNISLDESLTQWKGRLEINQFIPNKVATVGIKTNEICDSRTGYLWRFQVYSGNDASEVPEESTPVSGTIPALVLTLLDGLENKGHTVWMDNYYNSPALARELKSRGFDCVGVLRTNRQFVPSELTELKNDLVPGQIVGCTSGDVDLILWKDRNCVSLISTYHGLALWENKDEKLPTVVYDYNICMGGVDRKDQMLAMYPIERKRTKVWYKKLFKRLLNASVFNAYILYKDEHPRSTHREFRKELSRQIISQHSPPQPTPALDCTGNHFPAEYPYSSKVTTKRPEPIRRRCRVCKKRTRVYCEGCNIALCLYQCFRQHHIM